MGGKPQILTGLFIRSNPLRWKSLTLPRLNAPLPTWIVFPGIFAALHLPYYWDEAGYYIPAAWDFFRTGSLIPLTTPTNAHPPLPSIYLAFCWKLFGFHPVVTRLVVLLVASLGLTAVWRLALRLTGVPAVALWTVTLSALYPIWFAQSTLAHADIFAAACTLWGLVYILPARNLETPSKPWAATFFFALAALSKETAIIIPLTLAVVSLIESRRDSGSSRIRLVREAAWLSSCVLPLAVWYAFHYFKTGFLFGNPEFLRYNAQANLSLPRFLAAFEHRIIHLTAHMNLFIPVGMAIAALLLEPRSIAKSCHPKQSEAESKDLHLKSCHPERSAAESKDLRLLGAPSFLSFLRKGWESKLQLSDRINNAQSLPGLTPSTLRRIFFLLLVNAVLFSVLGGALLTRYLLPLYPLILLVAVTTFYRRVPYWHALAAFSAAAFIAGIFINPPYGFAPEDNLTYARVIRLHQAGIRQLDARYPSSTVLSAWPVSDELSRPELGYLTQPYSVYLVPDFTAAGIARVADEPEKYSAALVFSTKFDPHSSIFTLGTRSRAADEQYFGLHHDLPPEAIARQLHGDLVWQQQDHGQWIALIRFNRQFDARLNSAWTAPKFWPAIPN
jgi:4-amino-4-deoxy-L-arabinose transferase-like glycosyltransferase